MGTSAGIEFTATKETAHKMQECINELDLIVNDTGLGVSCTPVLMHRDNGTFIVYGQTHWSYDGENGRALNLEIKKWIYRNGFEVCVTDEYET